MRNINNQKKCLGESNFSNNRYITYANIQTTYTAHSKKKVKSENSYELLNNDEKNKNLTSKETSEIVYNKPNNTNYSNVQKKSNIRRNDECTATKVRTNYPSGNYHKSHGKYDKRKEHLKKGEYFGKCDYLDKREYLIEGEYINNRQCFDERETYRDSVKEKVQNEINDSDDKLLCSNQSTISECIQLRRKYIRNPQKIVANKDNPEISLKDIYFDIHSKFGRDLEQISFNTNECTDQKSNNTEMKTIINYENFHEEENKDKQLLMDHIKRLEYQNNIFLNNMLNMYYVCMDYIKMQDEKIKKKEEIILCQNKIITKLKNNNNFYDTTGTSNNLDHNNKNDCT
ncbi:conserved Plasmodium protein, unknown function [Plasmodium ovale]|uniref:Uncharacterized protein n=2 Tax=Plasmodium ovale TaxID=36330 RepID=A0A1A8WLW3_PLAOA|nr:conserved Plasmodium protein, unknown function [Plasmodium ovale curtisi]SBS93907.1 conserved Plasmodium protein, unknown function [Plasmodium ovale curtisi]SCP04952.1 conserved Plasmodium protein, unknown function [Plasmodium ovale]